MASKNNDTTTETKTPEGPSISCLVELAGHIRAVNVVSAHVNMLTLQLHLPISIIYFIIYPFSSTFCLPRRFGSPPTTSVWHQLEMVMNVTFRLMTPAIVCVAYNLGYGKCGLPALLSLLLLLLFSLLFWGFHGRYSFATRWQGNRMVC